MKMKRYVAMMLSLLMLLSLLAGDEEEAEEPAEGEEPAEPAPELRLPHMDGAKLAMLAHEADMPLWMSETGSGGSGIGGNLALAQRLIDDMRYLQPEAWIDWQYMEEANDQWCTIRGSFADQTYAKVKNYYVRQQ